MFHFKRIVGMALFSGFVFMGCKTVLAEDLVVVTGDVVNIRSSASTDSDIMGKLASGQNIEVLALDGAWFRIAYNGANGYISTEFARVSKTEGLVSAEGVNVRKEPSTESNVIGNVTSGNILTVSGKSGDFYSIDYNGSIAYIHKDYIIGSYLSYVSEMKEDSTKPAGKEQVYALVTSDNGVKLRKSPSTESEVLDVISNNEALDVIELGPEWHKVAYNETVGYVKAEYLSINKGIKPQTGLGAQVIAYAKKFIGTKYVYGGNSLTKGIDCSGFVQQVYAHFGVSLSRTSSSQINDGSRVSSKANLRVGDLVFFDTEGSNNGNISHVGIYIGDGSFIHASSGAYAVVISGLSDNFYSNRFVGGCRVIRS